MESIGGMEVLGGVRGCGCASIASIGAGTRASTSGGGSALSALLARIRGTIVSDIVVSGSPSWSLIPPANGLPLVERPPSKLFGPVVGPPMLRTTNGVADRHGGGRVPWGALRHAWMRILPSG